MLEAWSRGVPVVQPAHGSFPELIEQTGGGVLVPPGDADALARAIADLLRDREALLRSARPDGGSAGAIATTIAALEASAITELEIRRSALAFKWQRPKLD